MSESFNLDRTFCQGARCDKTESCDRHIGKLEAYSKRNPGRIEGRPISVANFADHDGKCRIKTKKESGDAK